MFRKSKVRGGREVENGTQNLGTSPLTKRAYTLTTANRTNRKLFAIHYLI